MFFSNCTSQRLEPVCKMCYSFALSPCTDTVCNLSRHRTVNFLPSFNRTYQAFISLITQKLTRHLQCKHIAVEDRSNFFGTLYLSRRGSAELRDCIKTKGHIFSSFKQSKGIRGIEPIFFAHSPSY